MTLILNFLLALIPGLAWLAFLAIRYKSEPAARWSIFRVFVLGLVMCVPAGLVNTALQTLVTRGASNPVLGHLILFMLVVGPNEEILKFLVIWSEAYRKWPFQDESDGMIFASASAIGFATYENALYMEQFGMRVLLVRAWLCVLAHVGFSAIFGHYLGLAKARRYRAAPLIAEGLFLAAVFHGTYDFMVTTWPGSVYGVVLVLVAYCVLLRMGFLVPYLNLIAPGMMTVEVSPDAMKEFEGRRFPVLTRPESQDAVLRLLENMDSLDEDSRLEALEEAIHVLDLRVFQAVKSLRHDPVEAVRRSAEAAFIEMKRILQTRADK